LPPSHVVCIDQKRWAVELMNWERKSGLGLGAHQVSGDTHRSEKSVGIAVLAYLLVLRVCHHAIVPGNPWSIFQLQHTLRLRVMTDQGEHKVKVTLQRHLICSLAYPGLGGIVPPPFWLTLRLSNRHWTSIPCFPGGRAAPSRATREG